MSVRVMSWVWDHSRAEGIDRLILLAIADCANDEGTEAWPSVPTLMRKARVTRRTVQRALASLIELGELDVDYNAGRGGSNKYRILMADPRQNDARASVTPRQNDAPSRVSETPSPRQADATPRVSVTPEPSLEPSSEPSEEPSPPLLVVVGAVGKLDSPAKQAVEAEFERFWQAYPRHTAKGHARTAYTTAIKKANPSVILAAVARYAAQVAGEDPKFIAHPATWLNGERWSDERPAPRRMRSQLDTLR